MASTGSTRYPAAPSTCTCTCSPAKTADKAGILPLLIRKWAKACPMLTDEQVMADLDELAQGGFVVCDLEEMEVYLCDFIYRDEIYRQPNSVRTACRVIRDIESPGIKAALYEDLRAMEQEIVAKGTPDSVADYYDILGYLDGYARPSSRVLRPFSMGTPMATATPPVGIGDPSSTQHVFSTTSVTTDTDIRQKTEDETAAISPPRPEVIELCNYLADKIAANGANRPRVTSKWLTSCRLLLDKDKRSARQVHNMIDWSQAHSFWCSVILSMPSLREKYEQMRLQAGPAGERQRFPHPCSHGHNG